MKVIQTKLSDLALKWVKPTWVCMSCCAVKPWRGAGASHGVWVHVLNRHHFYILIIWTCPKLPAFQLYLRTTDEGRSTKLCRLSVTGLKLQQSIHHLWKAGVPEPGFAELGAVCREAHGGGGFISAQRTWNQPFGRLRESLITRGGSFRWFCRVFPPVLSKSVAANPLLVVSMIHLITRRSFPSLCWYFVYNQHTAEISCTYLGTYG